MNKGDILIRYCDHKRWIVVDEKTGKILPAPGSKNTLSGPHYVREETENEFVGLSGETYRLLERLPEVGMPCTYCVGSDRYAGLIIEVSSSKKTFKYILSLQDGSEVSVAKLSRAKGMEGTYRTAKRYRVYPGISDPYLSPEF